MDAHYPTIAPSVEFSDFRREALEMQATYAWSGLIERLPTSKREFWFTLVRLVIVVAVMGAAARLAAIAFAPQSSAMSQQLNCPPDVVAHRETVVSPQVFSVTEQSATSVTSGNGLANTSSVRATMGKKEQRVGAKTPPTYVFARNGVSAKRAAAGELAKHGGIDPKQIQKRKAPATTLAHSEISPSPFGDMHGQ